MAHSSKRWNPKSLSGRITILTLGAVALMGFTSLGVFQAIFHSSEKGQLAALDAYSTSLSDAISAQYYERYGDVQAFAMSPSVRSDRKEVVVEALNNWAALYGIYDLILVVDRDGKLVAVNDKAPDGKPISSGKLYQTNFTKAPWFKAVVDGKFTADKEKAFDGTYVEDPQKDPYVSAVFGEPRLGSSFSAPIKDSSGKVIGVVSNRAGSRWFEVAFKEAYKNLKKNGLPSSDILFFGKDGTLFSEYTSRGEGPEPDAPTYDWQKLFSFRVSDDSRFAQAIKQTHSTFEFKDARGERFAGYTTIDGPKFTTDLGWKVLITTSKVEASTRLIQARRMFY